MTWRVWGAEVTLSAGRLGDERVQNMLREIERGAVRRFIGLDHLGPKPYHKERFPGEHHLWSLRDGLERGQSMGDAGLPVEVGGGNDQGVPEKQSVEESRAHMALNRERKKRRLPHMTVGEMRQGLLRGEELVPQVYVARGRKVQRGAAGAGTKNIVEEAETELPSPTGVYYFA